jgi:hypothetical protein
MGVSSNPVLAGFLVVQLSCAVDHGKISKESD